MLGWFVSLFRDSGPPVRRPPRCRLSLETLEGREVPATLTPPATGAALIGAAQAGQFQPATFEQLFLQQAARVDLLGFQTAILASQRAVMPEVRQLALQAAAQYAQSFGRLVPFLNQAGIPLPTLTAQDLRMLQTLSRQSGRFLDLRFLETNIGIGFQNLGLFSMAGAPGMTTLTGLNSFVTTSLPLISQGLVSTANLLNGGTFGPTVTGFLNGFANQAQGLQTFLQPTNTLAPAANGTTANGITPGTTGGTTTGTTTGTTSGTTTTTTGGTSTTGNGSNGAISPQSSGTFANNQG